jgi:hypothetical protein
MKNKGHGAMLLALFYDESLSTSFVLYRCGRETIRKQKAQSMETG